MKYRITHTTVYNYSQAVGLCQNEARLQPREFWRQHCSSSHFDIKPKPTDFFERVDFFGNKVCYFAVQQSHTKLEVTAISEVSVYPKPLAKISQNLLAWEAVRNLLQDPNGADEAQELSQELLDAKQYVLDSPMISSNQALFDYAQASFSPDKPLIEVVRNLMERIYHDFTYDPSFTTIATPLSDVLLHKRGVCQDFAHLAIGCLRSYGLAARYISGYVETAPAPGMPRLVGADASHAWFSVYIPGTGWVDFDPTNNKMPFDQHITLAWGRDYADVTPLKGIAFGGGQHILSVSVDVMRL